MSITVKAHKKLTCGWCRKELEFEVYPPLKSTGERSSHRTILICPHCGVTLPSSKKEIIDNGRNHIHTEWKDGDIVK